MRSLSFHHYFSFALLLIAAACIEPYNPPVISEDKNYLVVDGFLNSTEGSVSVNVSRTLPLYSDEAPRPELKAVVTLEDDQENSYTLLEKGNGSYTRTNLSIDINSKYRIHIRTSNRDEYFSEFVPVKITPAIDNLSWIPDQDGVNFYVDTHDPTGNTRYYKWDFIETYEYSSTFSSPLKLVNGQVLQRFTSEYIDKCWRTIPSNTILVGTSAKFAEDVINHFPVTYVTKGTYKLSRKYSLLVKQQAITEEAYDYWLQLEQTTENLGGLFDPMPTQITGNFYNATDPTQLALGFFSAGTVEEKRIFVEHYDLPDELMVYPRIDCRIDSIAAGNISGYPNSTLLIGSYGIPFPIGYLTSDPVCIDCRVMGGVTTKPSFWE